MDGWCAESDSLPFVRPMRTGRVSPESGNKKSHHYVNDRLSGEFFHNLTNLRRCDQLCDVVLEACSNGETGVESERGPPTIIAAHRVVLAAASPYFKAMFTSQMLESVTDRIILKEIHGGTLSILVDYMYSGRLDIDESNVQSLLTTASILQLACVRDACSRFLLEQLDVSNCLGIATFAHLHNCTQLAHAAQVFTQQHFRDLIASEEMLTMEEDHFFQLIDDDRLTTKGEEAVFEAVINWVKYDVSRKQALPRVLSAVRLPLLSQDFLLDRVYTEPLVKESSPCKDMLLEVCRYLLTKETTPSLTYWIRPRQPVPMSQLLMLVGGQAPKAIANVDTFDPDSHRWSSLSPLSQRRCRCGIAMAGDLVYAIGGFNGSARVRSVDIYDPRRDLWLSGPAMEARRSTLGVAVWDGIIVAVGGFDGSTGLCSAEMLDPRQGQWMALPSMTTRRSSVGVAALNSLIYAVGGYDGQSRQCLSTVEVYDSRANRWRMGESLNEVRSGAGVAVYKEKVIAAGGHDGPMVRSSVEVLSEFGWESMPDMSVCRRNAGVVVANGFLFALGGDDGASNLSSVECIGLEDNSSQWNILQTEMPQARSYSGTALLPKN